MFLRRGHRPTLTRNLTANRDAEIHVSHKTQFKIFEILETCHSRRRGYASRAKAAMIAGPFGEPRPVQALQPSPAVYPSPDSASILLPDVIAFSKCCD